MLFHNKAILQCVLQLWPPLKCLQIWRSIFLQLPLDVERKTDANKERIQAFNWKIADQFKEERVIFDAAIHQPQDWAELLQDNKEFAAEFLTMFMSKMLYKTRHFNERNQVHPQLHPQRPFQLHPQRPLQLHPQLNPQLQVTKNYRAYQGRQ